MEVSFDWLIISFTLVIDSLWRLVLSFSSFPSIFIYVCSCYQATTVHCNEIFIRAIQRLNRTSRFILFHFAFQISYNLFSLINMEALTI